MPKPVRMVFARNPMLRCGIVAALTALAGILATSSPVRAAGANADTDSLRTLLATRLDSLEMVKQDKKRRGESLEELERQTAGLKDSLVALRGAVARKVPVAGAAPAADTGAAGSPFKGIVRLVKQVLKPSSLIDWAIIAIGGVAVVSGIFLMMSLAFASGRKKRRSGRAPAQQKTFGGYTAKGRPLVAADEADRDDEAARGEPGPSAPDDDGEPDHLEPNSDEDLNLLRRRVRQDISRPQSAEPPPRLAAVDPVPQPAVTNDVRRQVLAAAAEGSDIADISRRFHLSADHVSLILKVAAKKK